MTRTPQSVKTAILVFAKSPASSRVKTRMQPPLSNQECWSLHNALLRYILAKLRGLDRPDTTTVLYLTGSLVEAHGYKLSLGLTEDFEVDVQIGNDLGERMVNALEKKFDEGFGKLIFVGTDSPLLSAQQIAEAVEELSRYEVVIGPTLDGGYYLIGFSVPLPAVLKGISWGTPHVYQQTVDLLQLYRVRWKSLQIGSDVDTYEDLRAALGIMQGSPQFTSCDEGEEFLEFLTKLAVRSGAL